MSSILSTIRTEPFLRVVLACAILGAAAATPAHAAPPEPAATPAETKAHARRLFEQGQAHYDLGEYDDAIAAFREAYEISSAPALLFNIAQSHRLKGDCARALQVYRHFVRLDPNSPHRLSAEGHITSLSAECEHPVPATPAPSSSTSASEPPGRPPAGNTGDGGMSMEPAPAQTAPPAPKPAGPAKGPPRYVVLGLLSGGLALAGAAAAVHVWNNSRFESWQNEDHALYTAPAGTNPNDLRARQATNNALLGDIRRTDSISAVLAIAAGASLVAGGTLFLTWQPATPSNQSGGLRFAWTASW
jgi:tetratricopeptide (TPR) repeat protein